MADPLYELLTPYFDPAEPPPPPRDPQTAGYLARLGTLSFADLSNNEPASLLQSTQSQSRNIQALSKRSHKAVIASASHLSHLSSLLPTFGSLVHALGKELPGLESAAVDFAQKYDRGTDNAVLDRRKRAGLLARNVDRLSDVLDLPSLLSSTITSAKAGSSGTATTAGSTSSYTSALDIHAHIRRLRALYPQSDLVGNIASQSDSEIQNLATILISSLQSPSLKLAAAIRTIGLLRRVAPELADDNALSSEISSWATKSYTISPKNLDSEGTLGYLFLTCRLRTLQQTLEALDPLRDLADQETVQRQNQSNKTAPRLTSTLASPMGSQTERYLKRYIEVFREHSFGILSLHKSIFPNNLPEADHGYTPHAEAVTSDPLLPLPSSVNSFALHLVEMLEDTLKEYMPNVSDKSARESLLTQILYCAGSLGRLGADFGLMVAILEDDLAEQQQAEEALSQLEENEPEWVLVMKKHKIQASRLEALARGVGTQRKTSIEVQS